MKFVPTPAFEPLNSLLGGVDALGCLLTIRVEAFSCRKSAEDKRTAQALADRALQQRQALSSASPLSVTSGSGRPSGEGMFPVRSFGPGDDAAPPSLALLPPAATAGGAAAVASAGAVSDAPDERFVFLVSCLNAIYGDDYDFTVLTPGAFEQCDPAVVVAEVNRMLAAVPGAPFGDTDGAAVNAFWRALQEQLCGPGGGAGMPGVSPVLRAVPPPPVVGVAGASPEPTTPVSAFPALGGSVAGGAATATIFDCDFFKFSCAECDPLAQAKLWSCHFFVYSRRQRLLVSLACFGDGNSYRGDDGYGRAAMSPTQAGAGWGVPGGMSGDGTGPTPYCESSDDGGGRHGGRRGYGQGFPAQPLCTEEDEDAQASGGYQKNRDYYGFAED